jgi:hypothetical protein
LVSGLPVGRLTVANPVTIHGLDGPRIEREFPGDVEMWKVTVRIGAQTGSAYLGLYLRDAFSATVVATLPTGATFGMTPTWNIDGPGSPGEVTFDNTCYLVLRGSRSSGHRRGAFNGSGLWIPRSTTTFFAPTHVGVIAMSDGNIGEMDVDTFIMETFG